MLWGILCSSGQKTRVPELRCLLSHQSNCLLSDNRDNSDLGFPYSCLSLFQTEVFKLDCASSGTLGDISNLYVGSGWGERRVRGKRAAGRKGTHAGQHRHPPLNREKPHWPYGCVRAESPRSCLTLRDPVSCSPPRLLCPWDSPGKNTGVRWCTLLQGIFPTQDQTWSLASPALAGGFFIISATREAQLYGSSHSMLLEENILLREKNTIVGKEEYVEPEKLGLEGNKIKTSLRIIRKQGTCI